MKSTLSIVLVLISYFVSGQREFETSIPVKAGQQVTMDFRYPELITIRTWDQSEILIKASVSINFGENDDAFEINYEEGTDLQISSFIKGFDKLPERIMIKHGGQKYYFKTGNMDSPEIRKFLDEKGGKFQFLNHGVIREISLEIMVPKTISLNVDARYGLVEIIDFSKSLEVSSKYGGIDASVNDRNARLDIRTKFGEVYSNLDMDFSSSDDYRIGRWATMVGRSGNATNVQRFKTEHGNVYLRKL